MTTNQHDLANSPAFPQGEHGQIYGGLSIRTYIATKMAAGMVNTDTVEEVAKFAVSQADALIAELCKPVQAED